MLIKDVQKGWSSSVNFIDSNDNFVGYDDNSQCCEQFGWFFSRVPGAEDDTPDSAAEGYVWAVHVPPYYPEVLNIPGVCIDECGAVSFMATGPDGDVLWLTLYNAHNGYYSHGWEAPFLNDRGSL